MHSKTIPWVGILLLLIGVGHNTMIASIWIATDLAPSVALFWSAAFGVVVLVCGVTALELERARGFIPLSALIALAVLLLFGLAVMPLSGFLTLIAPLTVGVVTWFRRRRSTAPARVPEAAHAE
ncbi:MAG: DUF6463 family protein [Microbacterium sp.]|nr:DUF6463 family protein [Microbacterium sp.]